MSSNLCAWLKHFVDAEAAAIRCARQAGAPRLVWASAPGVLVPPGPVARWLVADGRARQSGRHVLVEVERPAAECVPSAPTWAAAEAYAIELVAQLASYGVPAQLVGLADTTEDSQRAAAV